MPMLCMLLLLHDYELQVVGPDCTMTLADQPESLMPDGSKYNDCGDYFTSCVFFVMFQVQHYAN